MYFFEGEFICPKCKAKKMFYVYGRTSTDQKVATFSSQHRVAKYWDVVDDKVKVTMRCDVCSQISNAMYDFTGTKIGEWK